MCKTLVWGLKIVLCVGLILVGTGAIGLAQSPDDSSGEETQLANNKIVQILREKYELTDEKIKGYRVTHNLGYGEILMLYALADEILQTGGNEGEEGEDGDETGINRVIEDILAKRTEEGLGWGQIAQDHGLKLGQVVSSVRRKRKEENGDTGGNGGDYNQGNNNTQPSGSGYNQGKGNENSGQGGGDHRQGKKNKGKNDKGGHGKGKGRGNGKGKK